MLDIMYTICYWMCTETTSLDASFILFKKKVKLSISYYDVVQRLHCFVNLSVIFILATDAHVGN